MDEFLTCVLGLVKDNGCGSDFWQERIRIMSWSVTFDQVHIIAEKADVDGNR